MTGWWVVAGVVAWLVVAVGVGLLVARAIRLRNRGGPDR